MELAIAPKGRPYFRPNARWMAAGAAGLVLCLWALLLGCSRRHASAGGMHSMGVKRLSAERARLLEQVAQFNKAAQGSGFEIVAGLRAASPAPLQQAGPGHAARPAEGARGCVQHHTSPPHMQSTTCVQPACPRHVHTCANTALRTHVH